MGSQLFQWIFGKVDTVLNDYILSSVDSVVTNVSPVAITLFTIYVVMWGISHISNTIEEPVLDAAKRMIKIAIILAIALNVGRYSEWVVDFAQSTPAAFANMVAGNDAPSDDASTAQVLDSMVDKGFSLGDKAKSKAGTLRGDFGMYFVAWTIYALSAGITAFAALLLLLAKVGLTVVLAIGPVFILLLMFESTKQYFNLWVGQLINFMLTYILAIAVMGLIFAFLEPFAEAAAEQDVDMFAVAANMAIMTIIGLLTLRQVPSLAQALSGGIAVSTLGGFGAAARSPLGAAKGVKGAASKAFRRTNTIRGK